MKDDQATKSKYEPTELKVIEADRQIRCARFTPDGQTLVAGDYDAQLRRWDLSGEEPRELPAVTGHHGWIESLHFDEARKLLYVIDSWGQLCAWKYDQETPEPAWKHEAAHDGWIRSLAASEDGRLLATAGRDQVVRVWQAEVGKLLHEFRGHTEDVYSVGIHPDGKSVVSGDLMGNLKQWDLASGKCLRETKLESMHFAERDQDVTGLRFLMFLDGGKTLVCAGSDPTQCGRMFGIPAIRLLEWDSWKEREVLHLGPNKNGYVFDLHWHPDGFFMLVTCGPPGAGKVAWFRPGEEKPFFEYDKLYNTHALAWHQPSRRFVVAATNRSSQGNGAVLDKEGNYLGNTSPLHLFEMS